jgi:hypothetical protein
LSDEVPIATTAIEAALESTLDPVAPEDRQEGNRDASGEPPSSASPVYRRRLANYLLDKRLQLRYVVVVTLMSTLICGVLGTLIYRQEQQASSFLEEDLKALTDGDASLREFQAEVAQDMESRDHLLVGKMIGAGFGLVLILSVYLLLMTHKVAGPLFKISMYFDKMSAGRFAAVTPLRRGDMLQEFFSSFQDMSAAMRTRMQADLDVMERACKAARAAQAAQAGASDEVVEEIARLERHIAARRAQLG